MTRRAESSAGHAQRTLSLLVVGAFMVACSGDRATGGGAPSAAMCDQIEARLASRAFPFAHERASYDEIHYTVRLETCWETILQFLDRHFQTSP